MGFEPRVPALEPVTLIASQFIFLCNRTEHANNPQGESVQRVLLAAKESKQVRYHALQLF